MKRWLMVAAAGLGLLVLLGVGGWKLHKSRSYQLFGDDGAVRLAQITSDQDAIQSAFYLTSGSADWRADTYALLDDLGEQVPGFRSYVVSGADHGLLRTDRFYEYRSGDVTLRDWVADLVAGRPVQDIRCSECNVQSAGIH